MEIPKAVAGYLKQHARYAGLKARYEAKLAKLEPLKRRMDRAHATLVVRRARMKGGQVGLAERLIKEKEREAERGPTRTQAGVGWEVAAVLRRRPRAGESACGMTNAGGASCGFVSGHAGPHVASV